MLWVNGFAFTRNRKHVLLIEKTKPDWQAGRLNGIGGKVEYRETPLDAMVREMREEAGITLTDWRHFVTMNIAGAGQMFCYVTFDDAAKDGVTQEQEIVSLVRVNSLHTRLTVRNLPVLIALALDDSGLQLPIHLAA